MSLHPGGQNNTVTEPGHKAHSCMPDRIGRNFVDVGHTHPVTMCMASLRHLSIR